MFNKLKTSHKIILFFIFPTITFWASLYFLGPKILKEIWKHTDRYQNEVDCFVGRLTCFNSYLTEEQFIRETKRLELSYQEVYDGVIKAKEKWIKLCEQNKKMDCEQIFEYLNRISKYLDEIQNEQNK